MSQQKLPPLIIVIYIPEDEIFLIRACTYRLWMVLLKTKTLLKGSIGAS